MSKIFEALQGARSEVSELLPALVDGESASAPQPDFPVEPRASAPQPIRESGIPLGIRRVKLAIPASVPALPFEGSGELAAEQYRIARTKLTHHPKKPRLITVTSPGTGDGKTVTSINLAGALALKASAKVLLVDVDFRRSAVHALLGLPRSPGLAEVLVGQCGFEEAVVETEEYPQLHVLVSGEAQSNPSELLESACWHAFCAMVRGRYEYVILDSPPIGVVADCELIQMAADGVVMVLRPDHSRRGSCAKAIEAVPKEKLLGVLLNAAEGWPFGRHGGYGYDYGYGYGYGGYHAAPAETGHKSRNGRS
jgi:capsular exopolysaccharide synthesis family protein